jgi:hypothetical protein
VAPSNTEGSLSREEEGRGRRTGRGFVLAIAAAALLVVQARYVATRFELAANGWAFARMPDREARSRAAIGAEISDLLSRIEIETPAGEPVLLVTRDAGTQPPYAPYVLYHRALYHLYPRRVWWAVVEPPPRAPAWWIPTSGRSDELVELAQRLGASVIVNVGASGGSPPGGGRGSCPDVEIRVLEPTR